MIEVEHLTKYYGPSPAVLDVSFSVERGEILGFLGPNGAGKTTTMRIITGYLPATSGSVRVAGYDVSEDSLEVRHHIGYLPETVPLYTDITPYDYLDFMGKLKGLRDGKARKARISDVMQQVRIDDVANKLIGRLSKGYRQRVGLAQALLHDPDLLILDEPTVGLDPRQIIEVRELIKELGKNHTVILSTHILPEVSMTCTRVVIINRGKLAAVDTPVHLAQDVEGGFARVQVTVRGPRDNVQAALLAIPGVTEVSIPRTSAFVVLPTEQASASLGNDTAVFEVFSQPGTDLRARLAAAVVNQGWELYDLRSVSLSLEEVFLRVTSTEEEAEAQPDDAEYFEPGEEDDLTESEQEAMYEEIGDEAEYEAQAGEDEDEGEYEAEDGIEPLEDEDEAEEAAPPAAPVAPTRPTIRPPQRPAARKGGRR
jgi:ABC-2 type transport system ATP-binding protein